MNKIITGAALALSCLVLSGCSKQQYVDYKIDSVSMEKVVLNSTDAKYKSMSEGRDFYLMTVQVTPVHKKSVGMNTRPYLEGCVDKISDVVVEASNHAVVSDQFASLDMPDGKCKNVMMGAGGSQPKLIGYYSSVGDVKKNLQTGDDPRFCYLLSVPQGKATPQSVIIKTADRTITGQVSNQAVTHNVTDVEVDITAKLDDAPREFVDMVYKDICANPRSELYSDATEKYCTPNFKTTLKAAIDATPEEELGPIEYDYWLMTQDDTGFSYRIENVVKKSSAQSEVSVVLLSEGQEYNTVILIVKQIDGKWLIDDFVTNNNGERMSLKDILKNYK